MILSAAKIKSIKAIEILDSRGNPTIETTITLSDGTMGTASCPSGASIGGYEASELRDLDSTRFGGKGVLKAIENVHNIIAPKIIGMDATNQPQIDKAMIELDGTQNKGKLGANAIVSVSMAVCKAAARSVNHPLFLYLRQLTKKEDLPLKIPVPIFNVINGGEHAGRNVDFQEFMIIPASSKSFSESIELGTTVYKALKDILLSNGHTTLVGDEGGFGPKLSTNLDGLFFLKQAVEKTSFRYGSDVFFGIDIASNGFYHESQYKISDRPSGFNSNELISFYEEMNKTYHLLYLEDPLAEDDWDSWTKINSTMSHETIIVGDDLTVTNPYRLQMAINKKAISGIIIKPNQIGTVIETLAVVEVARNAGLKIIVSHRSGETNDDFIADLAVAVSADYAKFGAPVRGERVAKYNRLTKIEKSLNAVVTK